MPDEISEQAEQILQQAIDGKLPLVVPTLWHYEMCNLIVMAQRRNRITHRQADKAIELLSAIPVETLDHQSLISKQRIQSLAIRHRLSAYDATYLELADRLQAPLMTNDKNLASATRNILKA
ncbi:MAG: type II toxin-antitoxin system VapC family toxin [Lentisphaerae bacterium]|nr:type II toxin-antitoxin system VapC family toxin [Lentisphaerota bacterium]